MFRFDFVLNANQKIGNYQMRFVGLFDCESLHAYGNAILIYNKASTDDDNIDWISQASSTYISNNYEQSRIERLPLLGPLNHAPKHENDYKSGYIPVTKLQSYGRRRNKHRHRRHRNNIPESKE